MLLKKRSTIATLIAGSFFAAAQAGAGGYAHDRSASFGTEPRSYQDHEIQPSAAMPSAAMSDPAYERTLVIVIPDGTRSDGTSYSVITDQQSSISKAALQTVMGDSLPQHLTVFDPDGTMTAYEFTPVEVAYLEPAYVLSFAEVSDLTALSAEKDLYMVQIVEPVIVSIADDGFTYYEPVIVSMDEYGSEPVVISRDDYGSYYDLIVFDAEGAPWSYNAQVAAFDSALEYTG